MKKNALVSFCCFIFFTLHSAPLTAASFCPTDLPSSSWDDCYGSAKLPKGDVYDGLWVNGKPEGQIASSSQTTNPIVDEPEPKRLALLIGNADYSSAPLRDPVNDIILLGDALNSLRFEITEHRNADQKTMKRAIKKFGEQLSLAGPNAVGFFYFSGHGLQINGKNYLQPIGAQVEKPADVDIEMVSAGAILEQMKFARNGVNIVALDACRSNPFPTGFRSVRNGLAIMDAPTGSILAYATAPGTVAYDGSGDNSPYVGALAESMMIPDRQIESVFKMVRQSVMDETGKKQVPWETSSLLGEFVFNNKE
jgi:uncharacterized caspase-like protein